MLRRLGAHGAQFYTVFSTGVEPLYIGHALPLEIVEVLQLYSGRQVDNALRGGVLPVQQ